MKTLWRLSFLLSKAPLNALERMNNIFDPKKTLGNRKYDVIMIKYIMKINKFCAMLSIVMIGAFEIHSLIF